MIDLRSDTVTRPGSGMLEAMMKAKVGDDVFREDPTVNTLEEYTAGLFGQEAGLYCPSGTMTNQIAIKAHTQPGDEVICDEHSHIYNYEGGGIAFNSGVQAKLLKGKEGKLNAGMIEEAVNPAFDWLTRSSLVSLENTVNRAGGSFYTKKEIEPISTLCRKKSIALHLDGARIFNALAESGDQAKEIGVLFDSISVCLSKGLGAPMGSVLLGKKTFIQQARRIRKVFGGGMRQAGFAAAAGLYALENNVERLREDHANAAKLGTTLEACGYVEQVLPVYTNIVIFKLKQEMPGEKFEAMMRQQNIRVSSFGKQTIRLVTHLDFTTEMLEKVIQVLRSI